MVLENGEQHGHVLCTGPSNIQEANTHRVSGGADENYSSEVGRSTKSSQIGCTASPELSDGEDGPAGGSSHSRDRP